MKIKLLLLVAIICSTIHSAEAQLPLPTRTIGGTQFYYHEVKKKETVYSIAKKLGISEASITKYNPGATMDLKSGQYLFFPVADFANGNNKVAQQTANSGSTAATGMETTSTHTVEKGETLYGIAKTYDIAIDDIIKLNPEANGGIKEGQTLKIPQNKKVPEVSDDTKISRESEVANDTTVIYVTIRPGDTLFSTAKRYNTSIDKLMELNPGISPQNFKSGEVIRIRPNYYTTFKAEKETTEFHTYKIQRGDTYFSIARKFNVNVEDLKAANPDMKKPKRGKTLYVPIKRTATVLVDPASSNVLKEQLSDNDSPIIQEIYDSVHVFNNDSNINVAFLLPFMLDRERQSKQAKLFTEFYKGFLLAVDTVRQMHGNKSINVFAYDTRDSKSCVDSILSLPALAKMDIIFTPDDSEQIELIAKYGTEKKIAVINSFSLKNDEYNDFTTLFQVNTPQIYLQAKMLDFFDSTFRDHEVIFINMPSEPEKEIVGELKAHLSAKDIKYSTIDIANTLNADSLSSRLVSGRRYVLIPTSSSRSILHRSINAIKSVKLNRYDVNLCMFGYPEWTTYIAEFGNDFNQVDTYMYSRFFAQHDNKSILDFDNKFHRWYGEYMIYAAPKFGLLGYDTGCYFLKLFMRDKDYNKNFKFNGLQNSFDFDRVSNWSGFINKTVYFIHFTVFNNIETYTK